MDVAVVLFILRLLSALLLLAFFGVVGWLIYRDVRAASGQAVPDGRPVGYLRAIFVDQQTGEDTAIRYPLRPVTSIGRAATNTIVLNDSYISNEHALLTLRGSQWWLEDLNSRNGTLLNGIRVTEAMVLSPGDVIRIGDAHLKLEADEDL